jgi:CheY-like chemotaxis protein
MKTDPKAEVTRPVPVGLNQELRTGLNDIIGFASLLELHASDKDQESVRQILLAGRRMLDLIAGNLPLSETRAPTAQTSPSAQAVQNVLYVEDSDVNFILVSRILEDRADINLLRAECGELAVKLAAEVRPQLILLDLNLPDIHGAEVLRRLRAQPGTQSIPVVVISADATPSQIERLLAAGARNYLTKPFSMEMLLAVLDDILIEGTP